MKRKKLGLASATVLATATLLLLAGCSSSQSAGQKIVSINNQKASQIVSIGTMTNSQVDALKKLNTEKANSSGSVKAADGTTVPKEQVTSVVKAVNTGNVQTVSTALKAAPAVQKVLSNPQIATTPKVSEAQAAASTKITAADVTAKFKAAKLPITAEQAQEVATQHNLSNEIQLNAQKLFPNDLIVVGAKQKNGTYSLSDLTTKKTYTLTVNSMGKIVKEEVDT